MFNYVRQQGGGIVILLSFCKQDNTRTQKRTSTKLGRHGQRVTLWKWLTFGGDPDLRVNSVSLFHFTIAEKGILDICQHLLYAESRRRLRSGSTWTLLVPSTRRATLGDRAFPVAAARAWNALSSSVKTSLTYLAFRRELKTLLFKASVGDRTWLRYIIAYWLFVVQR